jgi:methyl-accepting chemotaxis protein
MITIQAYQRKKKENVNLKRKENMADNCKNNPRNHSAHDAMMAEIIVKELGKFSNSHELIMESTQKILSRYDDIGILIDKMERRDQIIAKCIKDLQLSSDQYRKLTELSMAMTKELEEINEQGIGIEPDSLNKVIAAVQKANEPIREHIRWLTYGVGVALGVLLILSLMF